MKNLMLFTIGLLIGAGVVYFICNKSANNPNEIRLVSNSQDSSSIIPISTEEAMRMMNAYDAHLLSKILQAANGKPLKGFVIPRSDFKEILADTSNFKYVYFNLGIPLDNILKPDLKAITLVYAGANDTIRNNKRVLLLGNQFYNKIETCPDLCP